MSNINYNIQPVYKKPVKKKPPYKTGSKYEPILTAFLESDHELVRVDGTGLTGNYLRMQLVRIIKKNSITSVKASVRNGELYLEKD